MVYRLLPHPATGDPVIQRRQPSVLRVFLRRALRRDGEAAFLPSAALHHCHAEGQILILHPDLTGCLLFLQFLQFLLVGQALVSSDQGIG